MGSKWFTGDVVAASRGRIQFDFRLDGIRYRPAIKRPPSEANLQFHGIPAAATKAATRVRVFRTRSPETATLSSRARLGALNAQLAYVD